MDKSRYRKWMDGGRATFIFAGWFKRRLLSDVFRSCPTVFPRYPECTIVSSLADGSRENTTNMEANEDDVSSKKIFDAPKNTYKSNVWHYFGFFKREGELDKTHVICKQCRMAIKYAGNTTNLATHMKRRHGVDTSAAAPPSPPTDSTKTPDAPSGSKACDKNSRSITSFSGQNTPLAANGACSLCLFCKR